jgi:hypothetical protein
MSGHIFAFLRDIFPRGNMPGKWPSSRLFVISITDLLIQAKRKYRRQMDGGELARRDFARMRRRSKNRTSDFGFPVPRSSGRIRPPADNSTNSGHSPGRMCVRGYVFVT